MLTEFVPSLLIATVLGFLAGIGVGGGSLLILWLTMVVDMPYPQARILNLLFFLPAAVIACLFKKKQGELPLKKVLPAVISGVVAAGVFSLLGTFLDIQVLQKLFGALLLLTGVRELLYRPRKAR